MPRYAVISTNVVENVIIAATPPTIAGRTVVQSDTAGPGDTYAAGVFTPRVPSAQEALRRDAPDRLRTSYAVLRQWSIDAAAVSAAGGAPTAVQLRALFDRFGKLCDGLADLLIQQSLDSS